MLLLLLLSSSLLSSSWSTHVTGPFLPGTSLEPAVILTDKHQVSDCNTFCIMCDVPSITVFCSEPIESFPGMASKFTVNLLLLFRWLQLLPVPSHMSCSTFIVCLYINSCILASFPLPFALHTCPWVLHNYQYMFCLFCFNYHIWLICFNFSVCVYNLIP